MNTPVVIPYPAAPDPEKPSRRRLTAGRVVLRVFIVLLTVLLLVVTAAYGVCAVLCRGPSPTIRDLFVNTMMETSAAKFVPALFFSDEEITAILARNQVITPAEVTDPVEDFTEPVGEDIPPLEIVDVTGPTFKGKMLIVADPSRVSVASITAFGGGSEGKRVETFVEEAGAIAGVNGAGFADEGGVGNGGTPLGLVIAGSELLYGSRTESYTVCGFDQDDHLIVGDMTGQQAMDLGMRDALSFGPVFIVNGNPVPVSGTGGGLNPRTVLGQRADGAVLILVIDGRQAHSIGASYQDCIDVMVEFEAINAINLDGGSSSLMVYEGEVITVCASLYGSRKIPNAIIVK